jgi:predicted permease
MDARTFLHDLSKDAGLALRLVTRRPGFFAVALSTLAIGIGAPAAIFSVVHAVLLRPLPYPQPDRLVRFRLEGRGPAGPVSFDALPAATALEWIAHTDTLSSMSLYIDRAMTLSTAQGPFRIAGLAATPNLFDVLGVAPALGRTFARDPRQVVLGHVTWQRFFAEDPSVVGSTIVLDGEPYLVTGVMPAGFGFPTPEAGFWVPLLLEPGSGRGMLLPAVARLRPDATLPAVVEEGRRMLAETEIARNGGTLVVRTMQDLMVGGVRRILWVLMAAVGLVFVIAIANISLLLMTRGVAREREFSIRVALGAGRARLVRQLVVEALILAILGGAAGFALSGLSLDALLRIAPADMPRLKEAALDSGVLALTAVLTLTTTVVFGAVSAGRAIATDPVRALDRLGGDIHSGAASRRRLNLLAAGELALTMVLLVGAGLLLRSFVRALLVDQGFEPKGALALQIHLPSARYPSPAARLAFHERLLERLTHADGVEIGGMTTAMPNRQPSARYGYSTIGVPLFPDPLTTPIAEVRMVSEGFIEAMGIPLRSGRGFRREDGPGAEQVMVISERLARLHFPDRDPIGQLLYSGSGTRRVVGVVGDVRPASAGVEAGDAAYLPVRQEVDVFRWFATATVVVRGRDPAGLARTVRALVLSLDPETPPFNVRTLSSEVSGLVAGPRFSATLLAVFAAVALVLAAIGVYGVMAHAAGRRTREIGVRVALGATRSQVLRLMIRDGVVVVAGGLACGLIAAAWLAQVLTGLLHDVTPADPVALAAVAGLLSSAGLLASYLPARRATRISALDALREE